MPEQNDQQPDQDREQPKIHVDEDWKKSVAEEKQRLREKEEEPKREQAPHEEQAGPFPKPSIQIFMAGLYTQTLIALGALESPVTGKAERNMPEAAYLIDTIDMLRKKTEGNLTPDESSYVQNLLYDLRMRYVSAAEKPEEPKQESEPRQQ